MMTMVDNSSSRLKEWRHLSALLNIIGTMGRRHAGHQLTSYAGATETEAE